MIEAARQVPDTFSSQWVLIGAGIILILVFVSMWYSGKRKKHTRTRAGRTNRIMGNGDGRKL
jgi:hypothetical protein